MPRCPDCSEILIPKEIPDERKIRIRTWSSGPELIRLSEMSCDVCSFIRKFLEKTSIANRRRVDDKAAIVLRDCHQEIALDYEYEYHPHPMRLFCRSLDFWEFLDLRPIDDRASASVPGVSYDPVLHACELFKSCVLSGNEEHSHCGRARTSIMAKPESLPRRLLDLSHDDRILTVDVQAWLTSALATTEELSNYCTLSYRWGSSPPDCMLSTDFIGVRTLSFASMPQTFKDAITVARALGIRFMWIDALCIVQSSAHGDLADWNAEGPRMWLVYQNAICTISATCSSDPNDGFLRKVGTEYTAPCRMLGRTGEGAIESMFLLSDSTQVFSRSVDISSLNSRGWVAQERLLSRRVLHFTEEIVFWECQAVDWTDGAPDFHRKDYQWVPHPSLLTFKKWLFFVEHYSRSGFTQPADRLIALSSIARSVTSDLLGTTYYAGIWRKHFVEGLNWRPLSPCSTDLRRQYLAMAPSWSWASVPDGVLYCDRDLYETKETLIQFGDASIVQAQSSNPYGNVEKGTLSIVGRLLRLSLPTNNQQEKPFEFLSIKNLHEVKLSNCWDELQDSSVTERMYYVVPLSKTSAHDTSELLCFLVVDLLLQTDNKTIGNPREVYQRIGSFELEFCWKPDEGDQTYTPVYSDVLLDAIFPASNLRTIVIV